MEDELKAAIEWAEINIKRGIPAPNDKFLAKHGDTLLAAVRLAEAVDADDHIWGQVDEEPTSETVVEAVNKIAHRIEAYRAAKEASDAE